MANDEGRAACAALTKIANGIRQTVDNAFVRFEPLGLTSCIDIAGPLLLDLLPSEALPRADVSFLQSFVYFDGANAMDLGNDGCRMQRSLQMARSNDVE